MTDHSDDGAVPVEDAATDRPPTVDEVVERQRVEHPERARTSTMQPEVTDDERATIEADGEAAASGDDGVEVEGPNSA